MRNHYIPRFILRNFVEDGVIHVYDKERDTVQQVSANSSFVIRDFYDDRLEELLAQLEGPLSADLNSIMDSYRLSAPFKMPDSHVLKRCRQLVLLQLMRTPYAKEVGMAALDDVDIHVLLERLAKAGFEDVPQEAVAKVIDHYRVDGAKSRGSRLWSHSLLAFLADPAKVLPDVVPAILNKGVILAKTKSALVLSDRGAMSTASEDAPLTDPRSEIFFPVSPSICVSLAGERDRIGTVTLSSAETRRINLSTVRHSQRWVASHAQRLLKSLAHPR